MNLLRRWRHRGRSFSFKAMQSKARLPISFEALEERSLPSNLVQFAGNVAGPETAAARLAVALNTTATKVVTVNYAATGGTAVAGVDYKLTPGKLTFQPGQSLVQFVPLTIINHTINEPDKTIQVSLSSPSNAALGNATATYTITSSVPEPSVSFTASAPYSGPDTKSPSFGVSLSAASGQKITVQYAVTPGSAVAGVDYHPVSGTLTFMPGQTQKTFTLPVLNDKVYENSETVQVGLSNAVHATLGFRSSFFYTITNTAPLPTVSFGKTTGSGVEGQTANLQVKLSAPSANPVTVYFVTSGTGFNLAQGGVDYTLAGSLTFSPGQTQKTVALNLLNPGIHPDKLLKVTLSNPSGAALAKANTPLTFTIHESQPVVGFNSATGSAQAPQSGSTQVNVPVKLSVGQNVTVHWAITGGTAKKGTDYTASNGTSGTLTFSGGSTTQNIPLSLLAQSMNQPNKTIQLTLSSPTKAFLGTTTEVFTILPALAPPTVSFAAGDPTSTEEGQKPSFTVQLSAKSAQTITVPYTVMGGDFPATISGTLTFNPGATSQAITLGVPDEQVAGASIPNAQIDLQTPTNATLGANSSLTFSITSSSSVPVVSFAASNPSSGAEGTTTTFTVALSAAATVPVTVHFAAAGGTAISGTDYKAPGGTLTFTPGQTSKTFTLTTLDDHLFESDETIQLGLSGVTNASLSSSAANLTYTIHETDPQPTAAFSQTTMNAVEGQDLILPVKLSGGSASDVTVSYTVTGAAQSSGTSITFTPAQKTQTIPLSILDSHSVGVNQTVVVTLTNPTGAALGTNTALTITIQEGVPVLSPLSLPANAPAPTVTINQPASGTSNKNVTITGQVADSAGLAVVTKLQAEVDSNFFPVQFDGLGNFSFTTTLPTDGSADGVHTLQIQATDFSGHIVTVPAGSFTLEAGGPTIALRGPGNGLVFSSNPTVTGTVSDKLSAVTGVQGQVDSGAPFPVTLDAFGGFDIPALLALDGTADGSHVVQIMATNAAGNTTTTTVTFILQSQPVTVAGLSLNITAPVVGSEDSGTMRLTGSVGSAVNNVKYSLDGGSLTPLALNGRNLDQALAATGLAAGAHTVVVQASDGTHTVQQTIAFTVSTAAFTIGPSSTAGWGYQTSNAVHLEERNSFVVQSSLSVPLAETKGSRTISFSVNPQWDASDQNTATGDLFLVYLENTNGQTLLSSGGAGTALFTLPENGNAQFLPGLVTWDGSQVRIDVTSLSNIQNGNLVFQLVSDGSGTGSVVDVTNLSNTVNPTGTANAVYAVAPDIIAAAGPTLTTIGSLSASTNFAALISNIRLDPTSGMYTAELRVRNNGSTDVAQGLAVAFPGLPNGVSLQQSSGTSGGAPYINMQTAIGAGGLGAGETSDAVLLTFSDASLIRFALKPQVLASSTAPAAPVMSSIGPLSVAPGGYLAVKLSATASDNGPITYSISSASQLPTGTLKADGTLIFQPSPSDVGTYNFSVIASDGNLQSSEPVMLTVAGTATTSTTISGVLETPAGIPVAGVKVNLGTVPATTDASGNYTLSFPAGTMPGTNLEIHGDAVKTAAYAGFAVPLTQLTNEPIYSGFDNLVGRPTYMIPLTGAVTANPTGITTITSTTLVGAKLVIPAGGLRDQNGHVYSGKVSLTSIPVGQTPAALPVSENPASMVMLEAVDSPGTQLVVTGGTLTMPNTGGYKPGSQLKVVAPSPGGEPESLGDGTISQDGKTVQFNGFNTPTLSPPSPDEPPSDYEPDDEPLWLDPEDFYEDDFPSPAPDSADSSDDPPCDCQTPDPGPDDSGDEGSPPPTSPPIEDNQPNDPPVIDQPPGDTEPGPVPDMEIPAVDEEPPEEPDNIIPTDIPEEDPSPWSQLQPITAPPSASPQGSLQQNQALASYQSEGQTRQLSLHYESMQADPTNIMHVSYNVDGGAYGMTDPVLTAAVQISDGSFTYDVPANSAGTFDAGQGVQYFSVPNGNNGEPAKGTVSVNLQADTSSLPSGAYTYTVTAGFANYSSAKTLSGTTLSTQGSIIVVNNQDSPFGSGWELSGWEEVVSNSNGSALLVDGNGSRLLFGAPSTPGGAYFSPPGDFSTLVRNGDGTFQRTMRDQTVYHFNTGGQLSTIADSNGNTTQFNYDGSGHLINITDPVGQMTTFNYAGDMISSISTPGNRVTQLQHDASGNLTGVTLSGGAAQTYGYTAQHLLTQAIDPNSQATTDTYNFAGRVVSMSNAAGTVQVSTPDVLGLLPRSQTMSPASPGAVFAPAPFVDTVAAANGNVMVKTLNSAFELVSSTDSVGAGMTNQRSQDLISRTVDAMGNVQLYSYVDGQIVAQQDSLSGAAVVLGSIAAPGDQNSYSFTGTAGEQLFYEALGADTGITGSLAGPNGTTISSIDRYGDVSPFPGSASSDAGPVTLPQTGTYTLTMTGTQAGKYRFALADLTSATPLTPGAATSGTLDPTLGEEFYQISGSAGERFQFHTLTPTTNGFGAGSTVGYWTVYGPSNTILAQGSMGADLPVTLPSAGTCILVLSAAAPNQSSTPVPVGFSFEVFQPATTTTALTLGGPVTAVINPGDVRQYTFTGSVGQQVYIDIEQAPLTVSLIAPDGYVAYNPNVISASYLNPLVTLTQNGTYTLTLTGTTAGSYPFVVGNVTSLAPLSAGGQISGTLNPPAASAFYAISGTPGQQLQFNIGAGTSLDWRLYGVEDQQLASNNSFEQAQRFTATIPETGTYVLAVRDLNTGSTPGNYQLSLKDVSQPHVTPSGFGTVHSGTLAAHQSTTFSYQASAGTFVDIDSEQANNYNISYQLYAPDGTAVVYASGGNDSGPVMLPAASSAAHAYTLKVINNGFSSTSFEFRVLDLATAATPLTLGQSMSVTLNAPYEAAVYTLNTTPGQMLYYNALTPTSNPYQPAATVSLSGPTTLNSNYGVYGSNAQTDQLYAIGSGGSAFLVFSSQQSANVTFSFRVLDLTQAAPLTPNTPATGNLSANQEAIYQFQGTAGQYVYFDAAGGTAVYRYGMEGQNIYGTTGVQTLQYTGTYYVVLTSSTGTYSFNVRTPPTNSYTLTPGAATTGNITTLGQRDQYTFQGTAGQEVELFGPDPLTSIDTYTLTDPSGQAVYGLHPLGKTGTYTLTIIGSQAGSYQFRLVDSAVAPALTANTSVGGTLQFAQDEVAYTFTGTQGERVLLQGDTVVGTLFDPDGNSVSAYNGLATLPVSGTYLVLVNVSPYITPTFPLSYNVEALTPATTTMPLTLGTTYTGTLSGLYDEQLFTFTGTAGQRVYLNDLGTTGSYDEQFTGPDGESAGFVYPGSSEGPYTLTENGTYTLSYEAFAAGTNTYNFRMLDLASATAFTVGNTFNGSLGSPKQVALYTFGGSAGQRLSFASTSDPSIYWQMYGPADQFLTGSGSGSQAFLPTKGTYVFVVASNAGSGSSNYSFEASDISDTPVAASGLGAVQSGTLSASAQTTYTFTAPAGLPIFFDNQDSSSSQVYFQLLDPKNNDLASYYAGQDSQPTVLPYSGTYTVKIINSDGSGSDAYAFRVLDLTQVPAITPGTPIAAMLMGSQTDVYRLSTTAGEELITNPLTTSLGGASVGQWDPKNSGYYNASQFQNQFTLGFTGIYYFALAGTQTGTTSYSFEFDRVNSLPVLASGTTLTSASGLYQFTGAAGQQLYFADDASSPVYNYTLNLNGPNGQAINTNDITDYGSGFLVTLPAAGSYVLLPFSASSGAAPYDFQFVPPTTTTSSLTVQNATPGIHVTYDPVFHKPTSIIDALGHEALYQLDPLTGNILKVTVVGSVTDGNLVTQYTYTSRAQGDSTNGQVKTITDALGRVTAYSYDSQGHVLKITYASGTADQSSVEYSYDPAGNLASRTDPDGNTTSYLYDSMNRLIQVTDPFGKITQYVYDPMGNLMKVTDARGDVTQYGYDTANQVATLTTADGVSHYQYSASGKLVSYTDPMGLVTQYHYDARGRLTDIIDAAGNVSSQAYDANNNVISNTNSNGHTTVYTYDARNRLVGQTNSLGQSSSYSYDADGKLISATDAAGHTTTYSYDSLNRLIATTDATGNSTAQTYDAVGNILSRTDADGDVTAYAYDNLNRLINTTDPNGKATANTYDPANNLISVTDAAGNKTTFTYDALNRLSKDTNAEGSVTLAYDEVGNLISTTDRNGLVTQFTYDQLNRVSTETWLGASGHIVETISYAYNSDGQLVSAGDGSSSYQFTFDSGGRVASISNAGTTGTPTVVMAYSYDGMGNITFRADTIAGQAADTTYYAFNAVNEMMQVSQSGPDVSNKSVDMGYNAIGQPTTISRYADLTGTQLVAATTYGYDQVGRLNQITQSNSSGTIATYGYTFDAAGRIVADSSPDGSSAFTYDKAGQLIAANYTGGQANESFSYDANGNRTNSGYTTGSDNEVTSDGTYNYTYDANGNLLTETNIASGAVTDYSYDYRNRLVEVTFKNSSSTVLKQVACSYDVFNNRIGETVTDFTTQTPTTTVQRFAYDGQEVALTFDGNGTLTDSWLYGPLLDQVFADDRGQGQVLWALADDQGSVRDIVNSSGTVVDHISYSSFGQTTAEANAAIDFLFGYAGQQVDRASGLNYDRARFYDAALGRFISQDPLGLAAGDANLYRYTGNSPLDSIDPKGTTSFSLTGQGTPGSFVSARLGMNQLDGSHWYDQTGQANSARQTEANLGHDGRSDMGQDRANQIQNDLNNPRQTDYNLDFQKNGDTETVTVNGPNGSQTYQFTHFEDDEEQFNQFIQGILDDIKNDTPPPPENPDDNIPNDEQNPGDMTTPDVQPPEGGGGGGVCA